MNEKMKVLFLSQTNIISGAEIVLTNYLINNKELEYIIYTNSDQYIQSYYKNLCGETSVVCSPTMRSFLIKKNPKIIFYYIYTCFYNAKQSISIYKKYNMDLIYGNNSTDLITLIIIRILRLGKIKVIAHCHDMLDMKKISGIYLKLFSSILNKILVPSQATKSCLEKICSNKVDIITIYNGVKLNDVKNKTKDIPKKNNHQYVLGWVGTICQRKRPDDTMSRN